MILERAFLSSVLPHAISRVNNKDLEKNASFVYENKEVTVSIDSRTSKPGDLFVAIKGVRQDGADFVGEALTRGAVALLCHQDVLSTVYEKFGQQLQDILVVGVADPAQAVVDLARAWRAQLTGKIVAITGSVGKTTTKELVRSMLIADHKCAFVSAKNQNNMLGLSLNLLSMRKHDALGIFEVGTSAQGEIAFLAKLLLPSIAVVTSVAHAHIQGLGSLQEIAQEKLSLFSVLSPTDLGVICGDQPLLDKAYYHHPVARFGKKMKNQVQARKICYEHTAQGGSSLRFNLRIYGQEATISLLTTHQGFLMNVLAASTVGALLELPFESILQGIASYKAQSDRWQALRLPEQKGLLISDCYNANPESMRAALQALDVIKSTGKKIAVLGDMFELGEKESYWHRQIGRYIRSAKSIDTVILVGERVKAMTKTLPFSLDYVQVAQWQDALEPLRDRLAQETDAVVMVKGSRGMHLEQLVARLSEEAF